ncbi:MULTISPECIES: transglycosylase domain-containing protein [Nostocales]|uniref:Penicillin-binding protein n=3 Tax=Nostocales TaxID=1161 RepID=A0A0C1RD84_9CYAN|nr:penicillin-binding protein 1A [Tolypothrix bouteillei]KAF3886146.1 penicillin-binding protein 1A [Tolypothrix bouteillei VB521301]
MVKFTSWFKDKQIKSSESDREKQSPQPNHQDENAESTQDKKSQSFLANVRKSLNGISAKLPGGHKPIYRRYWFWAGLGLSGGIIAASYGVSAIDRSLPDKAELNAVVREQTLTIKAANGSILQQQGEATREQLTLEEIPDKLQQAFIASEDRRFSQHNGVDTQGIARAILNNLRSQNVVEGGSTITQQLARILFLKQERTVWRKLKEARLAQKMEEELTKDAILERYLNLVYLGSGAYGVADAAWVYYSKPVSKLTLGEMATIAALPPAPNNFSPIVNRQAAQQRRNIVLQRMREEGFITAAEQQAATAEPINLKASAPRRWEVESPYFISYVQKEIPKYVSPEVLKAGGLTVETSLDLKWQDAAEKAVAKTLRNQGRWENFKQAALVAIDPRNGQIKAMVGGKDFNKNQFNRVTQAQRQPGSTFKGFVYATAIAAGFNPTDGYLDSPLIIDGYEPKNFDEGYRGWISMKDALTKSVNIVAVRVMMKVGFEPTIRMAHKMGIKSDLKPMYSLALGSSEVNLLELTSAYGTFATKGLHVEPHGITRILDRKGKVIWSPNFKPERALDTESAAIMTWMLRNVVENGTGRAAQLGRPVAGKTGTTDEARDLWFIGYIPQLVTGVWLGNDDNKPTWGSSGSAAYTWHEFMEQVVSKIPVEKFPEIPKLAGRKGTIKAQAVKPRRIVNRSAGFYNNDDDDNSRKSYRRDRENTSDDGSQERTYRRRRYRRRYDQEEQQQPQEYTSRRSRRNYQQDDEESSTSRRRYRRRYRVEQSESGESSSQRRYRGSNSDSSPRIRRRYTPDTGNSSESTSPKRSWRERLRPTTPPASETVP